MFANESSGLVWALTCLVIIVFGAVSASLLVDKRFQFSSSNKELKRVTLNESNYLSDLLNQQSALTEKFSEQDQPHRLQGVQLRELETLINEQDRRVELLRQKLAESKAAAKTSEDAFKKYRQHYRETAWLNAVGEKLGNLTLKTGKIYEASIIQRVTPVGLEIAYLNGIARVDFRDLPAEYQTRFQWQIEELQSVIQKEAVIANQVHSTPTEAEPVKTQTASAEDVERIRGKVLSWQSKIVALRNEHVEAASNASSSSRSVVGSLETWDAKAKRLSNELNRSREQYKRALLDLHKVAPNDPLLEASSSQDFMR